MQPWSLSISITFSSSQTETLYPLNNNPSFLLHPVSGNLCSTFCLYACDYSGIIHRSRIIQYLSYCFWLISVRMPSRFIYIVACIRMSFLFTVKCYSILWILCVLFIHSCVDRYLGYFHILSIVKDASMNMVCKHLLEFSGWFCDMFWNYQNLLIVGRKGRDRIKNDSWWWWRLHRWGRHCKVFCKHQVISIFYLELF